LRLDKGSGDEVRGGAATRHEKEGGGTGDAACEGRGMITWRGVGVTKNPLMFDSSRVGVAGTRNLSRAWKRGRRVMVGGTRNLSREGGG
jgi:hypothetical protein